MFKKSFALVGLSVALLMSSSAMPAYAQLESPIHLFDPNGKEPDIAKIPALSRLTSKGSKLYYLGQRSQIHGWLLMKNGALQMVYMSPDKQTVIVGALMSTRGENVTRAQVKYLMDKNPHIKKLLNKASDEKEAIDAAGRGGMASVESNPAARTKKAGVNDIPEISLSPGERLIQDMQTAAGVDMGQYGQPTLYMIAAPSCPVCKATWNELRSPVAKGKVRVRMIPVYNNVGNGEIDQAATLLTSKDPFATWNKFVDGDASALDGGSDDLSVRGVRSNLQLVSRWNIQGYPYIVYRGKDGRIKIVQGKPDRMAAVLLDLGKKGE